MTGLKTVDLGITRCYWVLTIAAPPVVTLAAVTAGVDISKVLLPDYTFGADSSTTVTERDITALYDAETPTIGKYKGSLHLFRMLLATGAPGTEDLITNFSGFPAGYLVRRVGPPATQVMAVGDKVDVGQFIADVPQIEAGTGSGFLKMTVPLLPQGYYYPSITLT